MTAREEDKNIDDPNTYSSVISVCYGDWKILLTGDNNKEILKDRIKNDSKFKNFIRNSYVLLAPHHGRDTDFCPEFFNVVNPYLTIVSDKAKEHDSQSNTTTNYKGRGLKVNGTDRYVLTTRNDGTVRLSVNEDGGYSISTGATSYGN
jgi:competence protein ComEC